MKKICQGDYKGNAWEAAIFHYMRLNFQRGHAIQYWLKILKSAALMVSFLTIFSE